MLGIFMIYYVINGLMSHWWRLDDHQQNSRLKDYLEIPEVERPSDKAADEGLSEQFRDDS